MLCCLMSLIETGHADGKGVLESRDVASFEEPAFLQRGQSRVGASLSLRRILPIHAFVPHTPHIAHWIRTFRSYTSLAYGWLEAAEARATGGVDQARSAPAASDVQVRAAAAMPHTAQAHACVEAVRAAAALSLATRTCWGRRRLRRRAPPCILLHALLDAAGAGVSSSRESVVCGARGRRRR